MNKYAMVIGTAFVLVTVFSAVTLGLTIDMYQAFAETENKIVPGDNLLIEEVRIPPIHGTGEHTVTIVLNVSNPTRLDIWVYSIEFSLFMLNKSTMAVLSQGLPPDQFFVLAGGSSDYDLPEFFIPSGGSSLLESKLTIRTQPKLAVLNTTDPDDGLYRPFVDADMRYEVTNLNLPVTVRGILFFDPFGVEPYEG
jgi:hypothetical protein